MYHKIETTGPPVTAKRRPIVANEAKNAAGKAAWEKMERDGVIEKNHEQDSNNNSTVSANIFQVYIGYAQTFTQVRCIMGE